MFLIIVITTLFINIKIASKVSELKAIWVLIPTCDATLEYINSMIEAFSIDYQDFKILREKR